MFLCGCSGSGGGSDQTPLKSPDGAARVANVRVVGSSEDITVTFDLIDPGNDTSSVKILYSLDSGKNFTPVSFVDGSTMEVAAGLNRTIKWKISSDLPGNRSDITVRVIAIKRGVESAPADGRPFSTSVPAGGSGQFKIAFVSDRDIWKKAYVMNSDGTNQQKLFADNFNEFYASLSSDGRKVVFTSDRSASSEVYVSDSGGAFMKRLTYTSDIPLPSGGYLYPVFSRDSSKIAFIKSYGNYRYAVCVMNSDGSGLQKLYSGYVLETPVSFTPDGSRIAFSAVDDNGTADIVTVSLNGGATVRLTSESLEKVSHSACFSPDGAKMVFVSDRDGNHEIYSANSDGSGVIRLTSNAYQDHSPCFSPDGSQVIYSSNNGSYDSIHSVPASGGVSKAFSVSSFNDHYPSTGPGFVIMSSASRVLKEISLSAIIMKGLTVNLNEAKCVAYYTDNSSAAIKPSWTIVSGGGAIADNVFTATLSSSTYQLRASFTDNGVTRSRDVTVNINTESRIYFSAGGNIHSMKTDGSGKRQLTFTENLAVREVAFSPDGKHIAFTGNDGETDDIYYMDARTFKRVRLTRNSGNNYNPSFSPDGSRVIYTSDRDDDLNREMYGCDVNSLNSKRLTNNPGFDGDGCYSPDGKKIVFESYRTGKSNLSVYTMDPDGSNIADLAASDTHYNGRPRYLKDGRIVFQSNRGGDYQIYVMNGDGANVVKLTNEKYEAEDLAVSPDSKKILFVSNYRVYFMDISGDKPSFVEESQAGAFPAFDFDGKNIVFSYEGKIYASALEGSRIIKYLDFKSSADHWPFVSFGGDRIIFDSGRGGITQFLDSSDSNADLPRDIYSMDPNGNNIEKLMGPGVSESYLTVTAQNLIPSFSPDASKITFTSKRDGDYEIYTCDRNGGSVQRLTTSAGEDSESSFSPDGSKIVFASERDGNFEVYAMNSDGSGQKRLTDNPSRDYDPRFSPDGSKIVFVSERFSEKPEICIMNSDGSGFTRLTNNYGWDLAPSFSPDGSKIVFYSEENGYGIYTMNPDGTEITQLTYGEHYEPFWWGR